MAKHTPILASSKTAAQLLDLSESEFLRLVTEGALPPPVKIGAVDRWSVSQMEAILGADAAKPSGDFEL